MQSRVLKFPYNSFNQYHSHFPKQNWKSPTNETQKGFNHKIKVEKGTRVILRKTLFSSVIRQLGSERQMVWDFQFSLIIYKLLKKTIQIDMVWLMTLWYTYLTKYNEKLYRWDERHSFHRKDSDHLERLWVGMTQTDTLLFHLSSSEISNLGNKMESNLNILRGQCLPYHLSKQSSLKLFPGLKSGGGGRWWI